MNVKSFFAASVREALDQARKEYGPDAMMLETRETPPEARHLGEYEVVCACEDGRAANAGDGVAAPAAAASSSWLAAELAEMRRQLEAMRHSIVQARATPPGWLLPYPEWLRAHAALLAADVESSIADDIVREGIVGRDTGTAAAVLARILEERTPVDPSLGVRGAAGPRIAALVGPPGAGKTATLVKLAARFGLNARRPAHLISMDSFRIAAGEQLRCYASILGLGFQALDTVASLAQAIEEHRNKDLILIDTPGHCAADIDCSAELARFLATRPDIDVHLTLTASMKCADVNRVVSQFEVFRPDKLLFTRIDETGAFGLVLNQVVRTGKPLSFFGTGQQIPEDLEEAAKPRVAQLLAGALKEDVERAA